MEPFANRTVGRLATLGAVVGPEETFSGTVEVLAFRQRLAKVVAAKFDKLGESLGRKETVSSLLRRWPEGLRAQRPGPRGRPRNGS